MKSLPELNCRGSSIVEFAVVLPLITSLLFGIVQYGLIFNAHVTLKDISAKGARFAILSNGASDSAVQAYVDNLVAAFSPGPYADPSTVVNENVPGLGMMKSVEIVYRLPVYVWVPGTDANGRFVIRVKTVMR